MHRVLTCLWRGEGLPSYSNDVYTIQDVRNLSNNITSSIPDSSLTVLVDEHYQEELEKDPDRTYEVLPLEGHGIGGWTNFLEIYRPDLSPAAGWRNVAVGLDTVFTGDASWLWHWSESPVGLPLDPFYAPDVCDGVASFDAEGARVVWDAYELAKPDGMKNYLMGGKSQPSEMLLLRTLYERHAWKPLEYRPERLLSYKVHVRKHKMSGADVVYFHGRPKPGDLPPNDPIRQVWEGRG